MVNGKGEETGGVLEGGGRRNKEAHCSSFKLMGYVNWE